MTPAQFNQELGLELAKRAGDPLRFVRFSFPWGKGELAGKSIEPWQEKLLIDIRDKIKSVGEVIQEAVRSGHGVGKSALISWLILWAISTMADTRGFVTANTATQLTTKTWPELSKWFNLFIAKHWFILTATSIYSSNPSREKTWRIDAIPWSENNTEAFAGLHNKGKRVFIAFDEASAIADKVWEVTDGATTDADTQILWFAFGNPTRDKGRFNDCFGRFRSIWKCWQIDSRTVALSNKDQIQRWAEFYGEDSDFFRVRVKGEPPVSSIDQFIPSEWVESARHRKVGAHQYHYSPIVISVDPAWTGDDELVIGKRQGQVFSILKIIPKNEDDMAVAKLVAKFEDDHRADAVFIDLGYGTGIYSAGKNMNRKWQLVSFAGSSTDPQYANKRAEMWGEMKYWLRDGGSIDNDEILCSELKAPEAIEGKGRNLGKIILESKEDMKARGVKSPGRADCLALTFAFPVKKKELVHGVAPQLNPRFDPIAILGANGEQAWDPLKMAA